jgi:hypothetical protein
LLKGSIVDDFLHINLSTAGRTLRRSSALIAILDILLHRLV